MSKIKSVGNITGLQLDQSDIQFKKSNKRMEFEKRRRAVDQMEVEDGPPHNLKEVKRRSSERKSGE